PDSVALVYEEQAVSYRELNGWANRLAHYLREMGVGVEIRVAVCVERSVEMVVGLLGVLKAGGAYIPLDVNYPAERLGRMIEESRAAIVLTQNRLKGRMPASWAQVVCIDGEEGIWEESIANPEIMIWPNCLAYVIYTSGSSGRPKGVGIEHKQLVNYVKG